MWEKKVNFKTSVLASKRQVTGEIILLFTLYSGSCVSKQLSSCTLLTNERILATSRYSQNIRSGNKSYFIEFNMLFAPLQINLSLAKCSGNKNDLYSEAA